MRSLKLYLLLMAFTLTVALNAAPSKELLGTWVPDDPDRIELNEELTFTDTLFYWKTGLFPKQAIWLYSYSDKKLIIMNGQHKQIFDAYVKDNVLHWNNRTYRIKK